MIKTFLKVAALCMMLSACATTQTTSTDPDDSNIIQVALLLDTSNSMDGLIDQAKSRLWNIVNVLTTLKYQGQEPQIQIALYEYGNDSLTREANWLRQVLPLTNDLDDISERLFALRTRGGSEYTGAVIKDASEQLEWSDDENSMKLIYIAGNESFDQGNISYKEAISGARNKDLYVNAIFCGDKQKGINLDWKDGAQRGGGKYFSINSDEKVSNVDTPYDDKIFALNKELNKTYMGYGALGASKKEKQVAQDVNAVQMAPAIAVERTVSKSKKSVYSNSSWDILDKYNKDKKALKKIPDSQLPQELKGKTLEEKKAILEEKDLNRTQIQKDIGELAKKRQTFIDEYKKKNLDGKGDDLGHAITSSIIEIATKKGFTQSK